METDLQGVSPQALDEYANLMAFFPFPQVRPLPSAEPGDAGRVQLIEKYADLGLLPRGAEANAQIFTGAVSSEKGGCGFFNVILDPDTVVRRVYLAVPYGRDKDHANWDIYASLDVQTVRLYRRAVERCNDSELRRRRRRNDRVRPELNRTSRRCWPAAGELSRPGADLPLCFVR